MAKHVAALLAFQKRGAVVVEYGNNLRAMATEGGAEDAFAFSGFVEAYVRPLFCEGKGPFRWVAQSGDPEDILKTDRKVRELIPDDRFLHTWLDKAQTHIRFQGLPSRICWVGLGDRDRLGLAFNEMVANGELSAPLVIGRDHMDSGSVASPTRETEAMADGSDAVSDWPILNALLNVANGATWVSFHHGGGVGMGYSRHGGLALVADGTADAQARIARALWNDPATGVMRHADAGYQTAIACARRHGLKRPMGLTDNIICGRIDSRSAKAGHGDDTGRASEIPGTGAVSSSVPDQRHRWQGSGELDHGRVEGDRRGPARPSQEESGGDP